ncbi:MAG: hybrid sensor histidine kinase/response regulator [Bacteroidota bacterium]
MILVVDDNRQNIFSLLQLLEMNGFSAEAAYSGEEALKKMLKKDYSLVILDVQMPVMDGFELADILSGSQKTRDTPVIFLSAINTDKTFITRGYASGAIDYITKPFDPDILLLKIKTFIRLSNQTRELNSVQQNLLDEIEDRKAAEARKDDFIVMVSHELRTPLTSLKGYLQLLTLHDGKLDQEGARLYLDTANRQVNRLHSLVNDLLDISKIENGKLKFNIASFNFRKLLVNTINVMKQVNENNNIILQGDADVEIEGDEMRIEQVLINYISNAIKYSPKSRDVVVEVQEQEDFLRVTVTDYGIGIPLELHSKLFDKFFRVDAPGHFQGMGIGLYICADIIQRHGGRYGLTSTPGSGSSFYFTLPLKKKA